MLQGMTIPSFDAATGMGSIADMAKTQDGSGGGMPADLVAKLQGADVSNIVDTMKELAIRMFDAKTPAVIEKIRGGIGTGLAKMEEAAASMDKSLSGMKSGSAGMAGASAGIAAGRASLGEVIATTKALDAEIPLAFGKSRDSYIAAIEAKRPEIEKAFQTTLNVGFSQMYITVAVASVLGAVLLAFYRKRGKTRSAEESAAAAA
jgi:hypothetical protein